MPGKVLWEDIYRDFRSRFPKLKDLAVYWSPVDYLTIKIYCKSGIVVTYSYETKSCKVVSLD